MEAETLWLKQASRLMQMTEFALWFLQGACSWAAGVGFNRSEVLDGEKKQHKVSRDSVWMFWKSPLTTIWQQKWTKIAVSLQYFPSIGSKNDWLNIQQFTFSLKLKFDEKVATETWSKDFELDFSESFEFEDL